MPAVAVTSRASEATWDDSILYGDVAVYAYQYMHFLEDFGFGLRLTFVMLGVHVGRAFN